MTKGERMDMLVKTVNIWRFLMYCDEMIRDEDDHATTLVSGFFERRGLSMQQATSSHVLPFSQLKTAIGILYLTLFFASTRTRERWIQWMKGPAVYDIVCEGSTRSPNIYHVICALRNAAAHEFDDDNDISVSFPDGEVVSFFNTRGAVSRVTFRTKTGLGHFLEDFVRAVQTMAVEDAGQAKAT